MVRSQGLRRVAPGIYSALGVVLLSVLSSCGSSGCGSGVDSATEAVAGLLRAAAADPSEDDVCRYVPEGEAASALNTLKGLQPKIQAAGGVGELDIVEPPGRRMAREHIVSVTGPSGLIREFVVWDGTNEGLRGGGGFTVRVSADPDHVS